MPMFSRRDSSEDGEERQLNGADHENGGEQAAPDEHTRLLPNRVDSNPGLLEPDDPAVSPYNLWSIRILRYLTIAFTLATLIWWILLLVSTFVTPPGIETRGSVWLAFGYATWTLANLVFDLIFFEVPSKSVRILALFMASVLFLDMILLLAVQKTRYEEGWVGAVSVIWALLMSLWTLLTDRMVKWGKAEEEERLTGRAETRRTLFEWSEVMVSTICYAIMSVAVFLITLTIILRSLDAGVAPPGKLHWVDNHKYRLHVYCHGNNTDAKGRELPTVLFEGGERTVEYEFWDFADNAVKNGSIYRYCFVDRPGYGWSDNAPSPSSAGFVVDTLSEALIDAGERGPWILASAGIGSIYSRVFSARHGDHVRGLLLIDPLHEDLLDQVGSPGRGFLLWLWGVISPLGLDKLPGAIFRGRTSRDRVYGRSAQQNGKFIFAKLQESLVAGSFTRRDAQTSRQIQDKDTPLVVISSGQHIKKSHTWEKKQRDLTKLTNKLKSWDIVDGAPHEVWRTLAGREKIEKRLKQLVRA
ncbi:mitochondrial integral membrane [Fusarium albosuccineum]|uniref:Mitochondrial integral membrane n=1 Tax=Fusarium albosuccineum TaxID=1237068 RepID=A0A8H4LCQ4_9HYPO|nr:mitochondrial integral membrane [Fusarium albosuccineum]